MKKLSKSLGNRNNHQIPSNSTNSKKFNSKIWNTKKSFFFHSTLQQKNMGIISNGISAQINLNKWENWQIWWKLPKLKGKSFLGLVVRCWTSLSFKSWNHGICIMLTLNWFLLFLVFCWIEENLDLCEF